MVDISLRYVLFQCLIFFLRLEHVLKIVGYHMRHEESPPYDVPEELSLALILDLEFHEHDIPFGVDFILIIGDYFNNFPDSLRLWRKENLVEAK